jgi:hypothetical protein
VLASGLQRGLDNWKEPSDRKTHFVLIDYVGAHYVIEARQYDGLTAQPSPAVRRERTRDRAFVPRVAALMIEQDFGVIGSFDRWPVARGDGREPPVSVKLRLKGSGLGTSLARWVKPGEVFNVVQVRADGSADKPVDFALLRVMEPPGDDGACTCDLFWRYGAPSEAGNFGGYRCLHLATERLPVRLKVTERSANGGAAPLSAPLNVEIRRQGFADADVLRLPTGASGSLDTSIRGEAGRFDRLAFVKLLRGGTVVARVPVALVADRTVTVSIDRGNFEGEQFARRLSDWRRDLADAYQIQQSIFKDLEIEAAKATDAASRRATLDKARDGIKRAREEQTRLTAERQSLLNDPKAPPADKSQLANRNSPENRLLDNLEKGKEVLERFVARQTELLQEETNPKRLAALEKFNRGQKHEGEAEFFKALELYKAALDDFNIPTVKARYDALSAELAPKSDAHRNAQVFVFESFPKLDTPKLYERRADAERACQAILDAKDLRSLQRLIKAIDAHTTRLSAESMNLRPDVNVDDERPAQVIRELNDSLRKLLEMAIKGVEAAGG